MLHKLEVLARQKYSPEIKRFKWKGLRIAALKAYFKSNLFDAAKQKVMSSLDSTNQKL
jgi:hypothetical protein